MAPEPRTEAVGFIGLGLMGLPMATNLAKAGKELVVYNRTRSKTAPLEGVGARVAGSPKEVAEQCMVTFSILTDGPDVEQVLFGPDGFSQGCRAGSVFLDMGTNSPTVAVGISERLGKLGVEFLDSPVTGGQKGAQDGTLTIMVGGNKRAFDRVEPLLHCMGRKVVYGGTVGSGQMLKLCNQVVVALDMLASTEALTLARRKGIADETLFEVLSSGAANSYTVQNLLPRMMRGDIEPGFRAVHLRKDLAYAEDVSAAAGLSLPGAKVALKAYQDLVSMGLGEKGTQALMKLYVGGRSV